MGHEGSQVFLNLLLQGRSDVANHAASHTGTALVFAFEGMKEVLAHRLDLNSALDTLTEAGVSQESILSDRLLTLEHLDYQLDYLI